MMHVALARTASRPDVFTGAPRSMGRAGWHLMVLRVRRQAWRWVATVRVACDDSARSQDVQLVHPLATRILGIKLGVFFASEDPNGFTVRLYNTPTAPETIRLTLLHLPPVFAAVGVYLQNPEAFRDVFRGVSGSWTQRLRKALAAAAFRGQHIEADYTVWTWLFDTWTDARLQGIAAALLARPSVSVLVFSTASNEAALAATLASVRAQFYGATATVVAKPGDTDAVQRAAASECVAILQAGEVLPPHALLLLVDELGRQDADALLADEDSLEPDGTRADPWFKPQPGLTMMCSGLLSRGVWLVRSPLLQDALASADVPGWAECVRLATWFTLRASGKSDRARRVPRVLTHRRADAEAAPPAVLAHLAETFLARLGVQATLSPEFPLRLRWHGNGQPAPKVSLVVPSRLRGDTQLRCLLDVLAKTTYPHFDMLVVVTQDGPLDEAQRQAADRLAAAGPARVEVLRRARFNYSLANNFGASRTEGALLCLLNDDVSTTAGDWLDRMVAVFSDGEVGIVGAKLYYPDMTTQHGGVIMGLAGLAEHVNRSLPRGEPGYMWRGVLDQEMSVVTGACLLVRRTVFDRVGGLDEALPTAFNDVDFCLRVRALKYSVVMAASVELVHHETLSFGHHYAGAAERELTDVELMRKRWWAVCEADPFHNPNLSLAAGNEWALASPPRVSLDEAGGDRLSLR